MALVDGDSKRNGPEQASESQKRRLASSTGGRCCRFVLCQNTCSSRTSIGVQEVAAEDWHFRDTGLLAAAKLKGDWRLNRLNAR
jgi:hypothetical protein